MLPRLTDAMQARAIRNQSLPNSEQPREDGDKNHLSKNEEQKADVTSKVLIDDAKLPEDLLACILGHLPSKDLLRSAAVCRRWQQVVRELTGNSFIYNLDLECPFCYGEVSDFHQSRLQGSSAWQITGQCMPFANLRAIHSFCMNRNGRYKYGALSALVYSQAQINTAGVLSSHEYAKLIGPHH